MRPIFKLMLALGLPALETTLRLGRASSWLGLVVGEAGSGKSSLLSYMALNAAKESPVLYVSLQEDYETLRARFKAYAGGESPKTLSFLCAPGAGVGSKEEEGLWWVIENHRRHGFEPELLVVDGADELRSTEPLSALRKLSHELELPVLCKVSTRRGPFGRRLGVLSQWADFVLSVEGVAQKRGLSGVERQRRRKQRGHVRVSLQKSRYGPPGGEDLVYLRPFSVPRPEDVAWSLPTRERLSALAE